MTCQHCRFWRRYQEHWRNHYGRCERPDCRADPDISKRFEIGVFVSDDHNLSTWLETGPAFGCVLFDQPPTP